MINPLTLVLDALWELVERHADLDLTFNARNLIKFNNPNNRDPLKVQVQAADTPELVLAPIAGLINMGNTSCTSRYVQTYSWLISTGDLRLVDHLLDVEWFLFGAMHNWDVVLTALEWPIGSGRHFVKRCDIVSVTQGMSDADRNRGIRGWSALWAVDVEMWFKTTDVVAELVDAESSSSSS